MNSEPEPQFAEPLTLEQAIAHLQGDDTSLRFYAAWWFGKFKVVDPIATTLLIAALEDEADRTPEGGYPLRRNAARALGKLGAVEAVPALIGALDCTDYYVREGAAQSLEMLGDDRAIGPLEKLLDAGLQPDAPSNSPSIIVEQPDASQPYDSVLEALGTLKSLASTAKVQAFLNHPTPRIQYAAARSMYQLTGENQYGDRLITALQGPDLQLRRAALMDVGAIGYLPAAETIAQTLAENSLKLISMKGLLEFQVTHNPEGALSAGAVRVMDLMDGML
jgi:phycocyanobilin lyase subunit alpha